MNILLLVCSIVVACCLSYKLIGGGKTVVPVFFDKYYTTVAKGIAILMIMVGHCSSFWYAGRILTPCGGIGVAIFLIISGYGLNESYKRSGLRCFWKKRLGRVYLPYFIVVLLYAIVHQWGIKKCLLNFSCINSPYWFITYIVECYIVFWLITYFIPKCRNVILVIVSVLTIFFMQELQAEQALSFVSGVLLSAHKNRVFKILAIKKAHYIICSVFLLIGLAFLLFKQIPFVRGEASVTQMNIIQCLIKYSLGIFILLVINNVKVILRNPLVYFAGLISYELYLVHFPFYLLVREKLWPALLLFVASFIVAYIFFNLNNWVHKKIIS